MMAAGDGSHKGVVETEEVSAHGPDLMPSLMPVRGSLALSAPLVLRRSCFGDGSSTEAPSERIVADEPNESSSELHDSVLDEGKRCLDMNVPQERPAETRPTRMGLEPIGDISVFAASPSEMPSMRSRTLEESELGFQEVESTTYVVDVVVGEEAVGLGLLLDVDDDRAAVAHVRPGSLLHRWNLRCAQEQIVRRGDLLLAVDGETKSPLELVSSMHHRAPGLLRLTFAFAQRADQLPQEGPLRPPNYEADSVLVRVDCGPDAPEEDNCPGEPHRMVL